MYLQHSNPKYRLRNCGKCMEQTQFRFRGTSYQGHMIESHNFVQIKMGAINSMFHRAMSIPMTNEDRQAELNYIYETACLNVYAR
jgi:hypothetical protein